MNRRVFATGVAATGVTLVSGAAGNVEAQEDSRLATPEVAVGPGQRGDEILENPMIAGQVQFVHPEKVFFYLPGFDEAATARLYGLDVEQYRTIRSHFDSVARAAAEDLLADSELAAKVDRLPFRPQDTVVAIGDSYTDDLQSWLEILRHMLALRRPQDAIQVVNAAVSARTSTEALHYVMPSLGLQPAWIFCLLGGNDSRRIGTDPPRTLVSAAETAANFDALRNLAAAQTAAEWVWITPGPVDEARADTFPAFKQGQSTWRNADLMAIGDQIRDRPEIVVDLQARMGNPAGSELLGPDGLHPTLAGHKAIARAVVERLAA